MIIQLKVSLTVDWRRLRNYIGVRLLWFPILLIDGLSDDMGPDAQRFYALATALSFALFLLTGFGISFVWTSVLEHRSLLTVVLILVGYAIAGMTSSLILRGSGLMRLLPDV